MFLQVPALALSTVFTAPPLLTFHSWDILLLLEPGKLFPGPVAVFSNWLSTQVYILANSHVFSPASGSTWSQRLCLDLCSRKVLRWLPGFVSLLMNTIWQEPRIRVPKDSWPVIFILSLSDEACCPIVNCTVEGSMVRSRKQLATGNL